MTNEKTPDTNAPDATLPETTGFGKFDPILTVTPFETEDGDLKYKWWFDWSGGGEIGIEADMSQMQKVIDRFKKMAEEREEALIQVDNALERRLL